MTRAMAGRVKELCQPGRLQSVVQPIVRTADGVIIGYEALARMPMEPQRPPNWWLDRAGEAGLRGRLELACLSAAASLGAPPADRMLFVNVSPSTLTDPMAIRLLNELPSRLVIEITEQEAVTDYEALRSHLAPWFSEGVRLAVDDTGAGYSSLRHVIELQPDFLKLDRELIREVDRDRNRLAMLRAVVAFASEVGTSVIAEGVETQAELDTLREAEVHLVQGYLLARPAEPWPSLAMGADNMSGSLPPGVERDNLARLRSALDRAADRTTACSLVVEHLFRQGQLLPSLYLESQGHLRCVAQRGLWQVLDGMPGSVGVTGKTWKNGRPTVAEDVAKDADYLEAIPGVVAEMCVPVLVQGVPVGALNVESLSPLPRDLLGHLEECADLLADRLRVIGERRHGASAWQRAARASSSISGLIDGVLIVDKLLSVLREASDMDSACLILETGDGLKVAAIVGLLAPQFQDLSAQELKALSSLVGDIRSCYTAGDASGRGFVGTASLRNGGARAIAVLPLWARRQRIGTLIFAHSKPLRLTGEDIEPLEMLADSAAALLIDLVVTDERDHPRGSLATNGSRLHGSGRVRRMNWGAARLGVGGL
jgi:EAL domain-containing protein (putative c-di-GMP-specific phosphodiesterase class I)/putative methionine-R-sulfoxide reductase with GAF domain